MIRITSKKDGFRRCGMPHPTTPTEYPNETFSRKELKILKAEPMLIVQEIKDKKKADAPNSEAGNGGGDGVAGDK